MKREEIRRLQRERQIQIVRIMEARSLSKMTIPRKMVGSEISFLYLAAVKSFCGENLSVLRSGQEFFPQWSFL